MKHKVSKQFTSILLALVMVIGMIPVSALTVFAVESPYGIAPDIYPGNSGNITFYVDNDGVLTWTNVPNATSYDVNIWVGGSLFQSLEGLTTPRYELEAKLNEYKRDTGTVKISVDPKGNSEYADGVTFLYSSPYPKLEAPTILYWGGDGMIADWGDVPHADGYTIYLYQSSGGAYNHWTTTESRFDFSTVNVPALSDGWYFAVQATSTENYRNSEFNESRRRGNVPGKGIITESKTGESGNITFTVDNEGVLTWTPVPEATAYEVIVRVNGSLFQAETITATNYELQAKMNEYKVDSGVVSISISPKGTLERGGGVDYMYSSPYRKLEAPANLTWSGMTAEWDDVIGADGYIIYLYQPDGSGYNHWTTTDSWFDFSGVANLSDGWYFTVQATSTGDCRNSVFNESLRKSVYDSSQTFLVGAYAYNATLTAMDGGGEVYLETAGGDFDWSAEGHIEDVQAGTYVTVKAKAADGYEFVEWRQGTQGDTISPNEVYSFYCTGPQILYAIFRKVGTMFPEGAGSSANNPAMCYSYEEFKYAMESPDIRYVALGNVEDMLPMIPHDEEQDPGGITRTAILVQGTKDLNLLGDAVFSCPLTGNYDLKYYIQLLTLTDAANSSLYIHGPGSLTYAGGTLNFVNSVIKMEGGHLTVDGATIRGSNGYHTGFCYGINAIFGSVGIQGGATVIGEIYGGEGGISAMTLGSEGVDRSLSVSIFDGKFYVERDEGDSDEDHGIMVNNDIGLRIYGMSTDGIRLGRYAADTLDDYVMEGCVMTVNGVNTDPATRGTTDGYVEVYQEISEVEIYVETPVAGESATVYPEEVYWVPEGCTVDSIVWYKNGEALNLAYAPRFEAGSSYRVEVTLVADNGVRFANPLTSAEISYKTATVNAHGGNAQKGIVMSVDFGVCPNIVPEVDLTVTTPKEGQNPSYTVGCGSDAYYAVGGSGNYTEFRKWYMSSDGYDWWEINGNHSFMSGYYYKFVVDIQTKSGYEFQLYDNGSSVVPDVSATVNGYYANVIKAYDQDPSRYVTVEYDFGECSDSIVEKITVEKVTAPVAGEKPNYNYSIRGGGYQMNTAKNAYEDIYWKNPPEQWYFIKNGIGWYDLTKNDWVYEHETFIAGHEYQVRVYVKTEDGFEFAHTKNYEPTVTATVNGYAAAPITTGSDCTWYQQVQYTFTCKKQDVSTIMIYDLDAPQGDKIPDREITTAYPELYTVEYINWYDCEDNLLYGEDTFRSGERYKVEIKIVPTQIGGVNSSQFVSPVKAYIDGQEVTERLNWDAVYARSDAVYVYYTFIKGASAPEIGAFVSGSVTSFNDANGDITLQLIPQGLTEPAYETIVKGNTVNYSFFDVAVGTYTLKVSKANHVTREYTVVVSDSSVIQDVKIHLKGDVNGDGKITIVDVNRANLHFKNKSALSGYELLCADINGDGKVTIVDVNRMNLHFKNKTKLW